MPESTDARGYRLLATCLEETDREVLYHALLQASLSPAPISKISRLLPCMSESLRRPEALPPDLAGSLKTLAELIEAEARCTDDPEARAFVRARRERLEEAVLRPQIEALRGSLPDVEHPFYYRLGTLIGEWADTVH